MTAIFDCWRIKSWKISNHNVASELCSPIYGHKLSELWKPVNYYFFKTSWIIYEVTVLRIYCHYFLKFSTKQILMEQRVTELETKIRCIEKTPREWEFFFLMFRQCVNSLNFNNNEKNSSFTPSRFFFFSTVSNFFYIISNTSTLFSLYVSSKSNKSNIFCKLQQHNNH